nr:cortactin-binding protein 2 [Ciona intestinalis]|eukprot:XP_002119326.3 cortactin-binding protein 2 [Ciona intestinalis]
MGDIIQDNKEIKHDYKCEQKTKSSSSCAFPKGKKSFNMTKLSKGELLRLLSILEGELEARDIYITTLQAQLNVGHANARYFQHKIRDPFLALIRDNEAMNGNVTTDTNFTRIPMLNTKTMQPLPLLEKLIQQFKNQQNKLQQHVALGEMYYQLVNEELLRTKRLHVQANDTENLRKEQIKLRTLAFLEQKKVKHVANEYKKLLQIISSERKKYRMILSLLLEEKACGNEAETDSTLNNLQAKLNEMADANKGLEHLVMIYKANEKDLKSEIATLKSQVDELKQSIPSHDSIDGNRMGVVTIVPTGSEAHLRLKQVHGNKPVIYKSDKIKKCFDVNGVDGSLCVDHTNSDVENKKSSLKFIHKADDVTTTSQPSVIMKPKLRSSNLSLPLSSTSMISSPTSGGAANFALDSPNEPKSFCFPKKPSTVSTYKATSFQVARQRFQRPFTADNLKQKDKTSAMQQSFPPVYKNNRNENTITVAVSEKSTDGQSKYKPQPPKPSKYSTNNKKSDETTRAHPPPLPPKKPNLHSKQSSNLTCEVKKNEQIKKKDDRPNNQSNTSRSTKATTENQTPKKIGIKRPTSLKTNNLNGNSNRSVSSLSAQQRLFHQLEDGGLRSPVTNNAPKSPLNTFMGSQ